MIVQEPVQAAIWHCLNNYAYQDAIFLAERLCSEVESDESLFTLATCYYRSNQIHQAYWVLHTRGSKAPQCRFLLGKCAFELKKYSIVEMALTNENFTESRHLDDICGEFGEVACFALQLIAKVCTQTDRHSLAAEANRRALKLNPFLWQSFADLCDRGEKPDPQQFFQFNNCDTFATCQGHHVNSFISFGNAHTGTHNQTSIDLDMPLNTSIHQTPVNNVNSDQPSPQNYYTFLTPHGPSATSMRSSNDDSGHALSDSHIDTGTGAQTPYRKQFKYLSALSPATPSFGVLPISSPSVSEVPNAFTSTLNHQQPPQAMLVEVNDQKTMAKKMKSQVGTLISRKDTPLQLSKPIFSQTGNITPRTPNTNAMGGQNVRRSSRLSFSNCSAVKENNKSATINKFATPRSPPRKTKQRIAKMNLTNTALNELNNEKQTLLKMEKEKIETITSGTETITTAAADQAHRVLYHNQINTSQHLLQLKRNSAEGLMSLLRDLGAGYLQLSQFQCRDAIDTFTAVPHHHFFSSWVQSMIGKAHHELLDYEASVRVFQDIHKREPHRIEMMEVYSTSLWHLNREVALSALAQDLVGQDKSSPITWCVSGNCFSLHKEHETAIKFFERAVQVDPDFTFSYTLLGHELVITEELDKALSCFRTAIHKNARHYNAWFGIGTIYSKQERYSLAEIHFRHALSITPNNSVLMVHIGTMQLALKRADKALETLNAAIAVDPKNPLCKFHRGSLYFQMGKHNEALAELEELKQVLPKESVVYYLIGKIHKKMGNVAAALMHFSWATDLDPRGANNQIKDAFDAHMSHGTGLVTGTLDITSGGTNSSDLDVADVTVDDSTIRNELLETIPEEPSDDSTQARGGSGAEDNESGGRDYTSDSY